MAVASHDELLEACRVLFGRALEPSFLSHLQHSGLRVAWRHTALQTHPDRTLDVAAKRRHAERFMEARRAYGLLREYVDNRPPGPGLTSSRTAHPSPTPRGTQRARAQQPRPQRPQRHQRHAPPGHDEHRAAPGLPRRRLRFGEYLLHSHVIGFPTLIEAILWQRRQRDRFCEVGRRWGYLTDAEVVLLLARRGAFEPIGATAQRLRLLTSLQVRTVLYFQRSRQEPIGSYFIRRGLLSPDALERLLGRFERHNASFGPAA